MYLFVDVISLFRCQKKFLEVCLPKFLGFLLCPLLLSGAMVLNSEIHKDVSELPLTHEGDVVVYVDEVIEEFLGIIHLDLSSSLFLNLFSNIFRDVNLMIAGLTINVTRTLTVLQHMFDPACVARETLTA